MSSTDLLASSDIKQAVELPKDDRHNSRDGCSENCGEDRVYKTIECATIRTAVSLPSIRIEGPCKVFNI